MKEGTIATNFEPHECVIFVQSTKTGTHKNKAIKSMTIYRLKTAWVITIHQSAAEYVSMTLTFSLWTKNL